MPGKTRHFQTLILNDSITLCDCPGLVFPTFLNSQADLVCNGILPIDRLRDYLPSCELVARRIDKRQHVSLYGLRFPEHIQAPNAHELLCEFARVRGLVTGRGLPDEAQAARYILKDFANGRLLYCHPPPDADTEVFLANLEAPALKTTRPIRAPLLFKAPADPILASTMQTGGRADPDKGFKKSARMARARAKAHLRAHRAEPEPSRKQTNRRNVIAVTDYEMIDN